MSTGKSSITLLEAVHQAQLSWIQGGVYDEIVNELGLELDKPGPRAAVVYWFIDGRFATSGETITASTLINERSQPQEIDLAFEEILSFVGALGDSGGTLAKKLRSMNRNLLDNCKV